MYLIAGLGNPGTDYHRTRHNAGFMLVDRLADRARASFGHGVGASLIARARVGARDLILAKPQTFMNLSGRALRGLTSRYSIELSNILVVYDDVALPLGRIRLRGKGSGGGQKGMKSVISALGTEEVPRLRIGVLHGDRPWDMSDYVLSKFTRAEEKTLDEALDRAVQACDTWLYEGIDKAMTLFNQT